MSRRIEPKVYKNDKNIKRIKDLVSCTGRKKNGARFLHCRNDKILQLNALIVNLKDLPDEWYDDMMANNDEVKKKVAKALKSYFTEISGKIPNVTRLSKSTSFKVEWPQFGCYCTCKPSSSLRFHYQCQCTQKTPERLLRNLKQHECRRMKFTALPILNHAVKRNLLLVVDDREFELHLDVFASQFCWHEKCFGRQSPFHQKRSSKYHRPCMLLHPKDVVYVEQLIKMRSKHVARHAKLLTAKDGVTYNLNALVRRKKFMEEANKLKTHWQGRSHKNYMQMKGYSVLEIEENEYDIAQKRQELQNIRYEIMTFISKQKNRARRDLACCIDTKLISTLNAHSCAGSVSSDSYDSVMDSLGPLPMTRTTSDATSQYTVNLTSHAQDRAAHPRNLRAEPISNKEFMRARKEGETQNAWRPARDGRWAVTTNWQTYIFDSTRHDVISTYSLFTDYSHDEATR